MEFSQWVDEANVGSVGADLVDRADGVVITYYLHVSVLPYSDVALCRTHTDMQSKSWVYATSGRSAWFLQGRHGWAFGIE